MLYLAVSRVAAFPFLVYLVKEKGTIGNKLYEYTDREIIFRSVFFCR